MARGRRARSPDYRPDTWTHDLARAEKAHEATVAKELVTVRAALKLAVRAGVWLGNPAAGIYAGSSLRLAELGSKLDLTWIAGGQVQVAVYGGDDASPAWSSVDGG
jgi:hypothetical protein